MDNPIFLGKNLEICLLFPNFVLRSNMKKQLTMAVVGFSLLSFLFSCSKPKNTNLQVYLTATPSSAYEAVNVDIKEVWVKTTKDNTGWFFLKTNQNTLNLNRIASGRDTILAVGSIPMAEIREVRFILGTRNSVIKSAKCYPAGVNPNLENNAVTLQVKRILQSENERVTFTFDVPSSINTTNQNEYFINPVIRLK